MLILSHRGYWKDPAEKNLAVAFERSFDLGYGTETDVRDCQGELLIAHDMPRGDEMTLRELLTIMNGRNLPLALNIKADGLAENILKELQAAGQTQYFNFDMSIPDMVAQVRKGARVFSGLSDINPVPPYIEHAAGIWLDSFWGEWFDMTLPVEWLEKGKEVCIVSADLHRRDRAEQWQKLKASGVYKLPGLMLCTDYPEEAMAFFHDKD